LNAVFASTIPSVKFYKFFDSLVVTVDADTYIKANKRDNIVFFVRAHWNEREGLYYLTLAYHRKTKKKRVNRERRRIK
jgi:hypothetical protein